MCLLPENGAPPFQVSEIQLAYKSRVKAADRPRISHSAVAARLFLQFWNRDTLELTESMKVMYLDSRNRVLGFYHLSEGGITKVVADPRLIVLAALKLRAESVMICHNHPSGDTTPSLGDRTMTQNLKAACALFDIKLRDHLILTADSYYSFDDNGQL